MKSGCWDRVRVQLGLAMVCGYPQAAPSAEYNVQVCSEVSSVSRPPRQGWGWGREGNLGYKEIIAAIITVIVMRKVVKCQFREQQFDERIAESDMRGPDPGDAFVWGSKPRASQEVGTGHPLSSAVGV